AAELAQTELAERGWKQATAINATAVAARATHLRAAAGERGRLAEVGNRPGFPVALARTIGELRMAGLRPEDLATLGPVASDLAALYARWLAGMEAFG